MQSLSLSYLSIIEENLEMKGSYIAATTPCTVKVQATYCKYHLCIKTTSYKNHKIEFLCGMHVLLNRYIKTTCV